MACDLCNLLEAPAEGVIIWGDELLVVINVDEPSIRASRAWSGARTSK
jgi:hypothetical protein